MNHPFPEPGRERWQPLRAGLVDLFYYDAEEFRFHDGRLLLRGNNGTGKSKVLALTLPFLLDGELAPHRVEPDADPKKRMEWNLLLGGAHPHPERLGYTWLEFGRVRADGTAEYRTVGCGMKAVSGRGIARHWFFVTDQRVGGELSLVDATRTALSRDRLVEALAERGTVYDRARDYRRAVDEALFGLGEQRYTALVDLLVQLRQPQLSKRPNEKALSGALTESLPPLDQAVIADVAEAFRSLEEDRDALAAMGEAHRAATSFLGHYRRYAGIASRRRAALPRRAQSVYEATNRDLTEAEDGYAAAQRALAAAETTLSELDRAEARLQAQDQALRAGPEMRSAHELDRAAEQARKLGEDAARLAREHTAASRELAKREDKAATAQSRVDEAASELGAAAHAARDAADVARITAGHADRVDSALDSTAVPALRAAGQDIAERQQRAIGHVQTMITAVERTHRELSTARHRVEDLDAESARLTERRQEAARTVAGRGHDLVDAVRAHLGACTELAVADPASVLAALELWVETLDGPNPARAVVEAAGHEAASRLARTEAALGSRREVAQQRQTVLTDEITKLESGEDSTPPAPYTRDGSTRDGRSGAPLWRLVDFADGLSDQDRAGVEAALEAAGILDAWVTPAGELLAVDTDDVMLRAHAGPGPAAGLRTVLRPAVDRADQRAATVADDTIAELLDAIGFGAGPGDVWVTAGGRFRIGVLEGAWRKPAAEYIGRGAREAARRKRLTELRAELATIEAELAEIAEADRDLVRRRGVLSGELADYPPDNQLRDAHSDVAALARQHEELAERRQTAQRRLAAATAEADRASDELAESSAELDLPAESGALARVREGLTRYREALAGLWPAVHRLADARRELVDAIEDVTLAEGALAERAELAAEAALAAEEAAERHRTLEETVGAAVAELQQRLAEVSESLRRCQADRKAADARLRQALTESGKAEGRRGELRGKLASATEERVAAAAALRRFAATGLITVALPELELPAEDATWAPDPTVRLARQVDRELAGLPDDDDAWDRTQRRVTEELKSLSDTLSRHGNSASARLLEDGMVVDVVFQGHPTTVPELADALGSEVDERGRLLNAREREILENHLLNEVASTLQELISAAEAQVARMNGELSDRPTSTGMRLRLRWLPVEDGPAGLDAARERLLRQTSDAWSESDRAAVGEFLQARIAKVRADDDGAGTWLEHLAQALDYRHWHRFVIQRHQNGQWRSATGPASGGERVLAASVPLFAAASSHYASAGNPHAPRLVTLDEAFAGVDDNARAKYLGLLAAFDLDVVMTSEREWGCYPQVPGLGIAQLSRTDDIAAVLVTQWEWDGRRRTLVDRPVAGLSVAPVEPEPSLG